MKKIILSFIISTFLYSEMKACSWYDADYDYFNLFTQSIIRDKSYIPFLLAYSNRFYDHEHYEIKNENIESWQNFFGNKLDYKETKTLVHEISLDRLNEYISGKSTHPILGKIGAYSSNSEAIDYLILAKKMEPFMKVGGMQNPNENYFFRQEHEKNYDVTELNYNQTLETLISAYKNVQNPEIKLRYGYQIVRFLHYTLNFSQAIDAFSTYVEPLGLKSAIYYWALDQKAGAQRGLGKDDEANRNFFQVFMHCNSRRESAFTSMKLLFNNNFEELLSNAKNEEEKNMAYFLLAYDGFNNPLPIMEKMYEINPSSEILKVLAARSINELERKYLPIQYISGKEMKTMDETVNTVKSTNTEKGNKNGFWQKFLAFFSDLFHSKSDNKEEENYTENPGKFNANRIPWFNPHFTEYYNNQPVNYINDLEKFIEKTQEKSNDEFWKIAFAYLKFLKNDYKASDKILSEITTDNSEYKNQISRMKMLNEIVSKPKINADFEEEIWRNYGDLFLIETKSKFNYELEMPTTAEFLKDVLANRYFLQKEYGKSFLMNNKLSDLQFRPNVNLTKSIEEFYKKPNKSTLEQQVIMKNADVENADAFFQLIYGDHEMRNANFEKAAEFYKNATTFTGIPRTIYHWDEDSVDTQPMVYGANFYDGFRNITDLVFGHNVWESFESPKEMSMKAEDLSSFPFLSKKMNKLELANALIELKKVGSTNGKNAAKANQLIGNLLYNTSMLGYFREIFVMDVNNLYNQKFNFQNTDYSYQFYYKNYSMSSFVPQDNFDLAIKYYQKALITSDDPEQKARIIFQMASAEQGKYYQWETQQQQIQYDAPDWNEQMKQREQNLKQHKNQHYRNYFSLLKTEYSNTETVRNLQNSCSYFEYFMK
ncbi:MAG: hypothetical protein Q4G27_00785 [Flavobacteriaceae bacterium]|nr:hypothetical protein [Flavobacteriaceae bacterium]